MAFTISSVTFRDDFIEIYADEHDTYIDKLIQLVDAPSQDYHEKVVSNTEFTSTVVIKRTIQLKYAFITILRECLDKLSILRIMMNEKIDTRWIKDIVYRSPEIRFQSDTQDEEEFSLYEYTNYRKLAKDIFCIHNMLQKTLIELEEQNTATYIHSVMNIIEQETNDGLEVLRQLEENTNFVHQAMTDLKKANSKSNHSINDKTEEASKMQDKYEEVLAYTTTEANYINRYEDNRCYLNDFSNNVKEKTLQDFINEYQAKYMMEKRIHKEISEYIDCSVLDLQEKIEYWINKYDSEVERNEGDIFEVKVDRDKLENEFCQLRREYESRKREMNAWIKLKEELRIKAMLEKKLNAAAVKIQAWWRGEMVRKHLGPYGKKSKKGKKGKKGNKNEKKGKNKK